MTSTNTPPSASSMKIAVWLSGHRPVTPTIVVTARRNTHDAMRTTRSYARVVSSSWARSASPRPTTAAAAIARSERTSPRSSDGVPERTRSMTGDATKPAITARFARTAMTISARIGSNDTQSS